MMTCLSDLQYYTSVSQREIGESHIFLKKTKQELLKCVIVEIFEKLSGT